MSGPLASDDFYMTAKPTEVFEPPSFGGGGGSPFSGIEGLLMNYAMTDAMGSAQRNAQQKVGGVMSGIQSLVSEAFPNFSGGGGGGGGGGGMSTTGQLGGGFNSVNQITQPTSPAPFTPAISPSDMGFPAPKMGNFSGDQSPLGGSTFETDFLTPEQKEKFGITTTNYQGPISLPVMGPNSNSQTYMGPTTTPFTSAPTPMDGGGGIGLPPTGFNTAFNGPKVPSFMDESGGIGLPPSFNMPKPPSFVPSSFNTAVGLGGNPFKGDLSQISTPMYPTSGVGAGVDVKTNPTLNDVSVSQYNPALGFGGSSNAPQLSPYEQQQMMFKAFKGKGMAPAGLGIGNLLEEPPINLTYNTNMENSPF